MNNKTTIIMAIIVMGILTAIGVGFVTSQPQPQEQTPQPVEVSPPSKVELEAKLLDEQSSIDQALQTTLPTLQETYKIERSALYGRGEWYGAVLQYTGGDVNSRDSLRLVMQKKNGTWVLRTTPPQILVNIHDLQDAPIAMLNDLNKPTTLLGTESSPTITPGE